MVSCSGGMAIFLLSCPVAMVVLFESYLIVIKQLNSIFCGSHRCLCPSDKLGYRLTSYLCNSSVPGTRVGGNKMIVAHPFYSRIKTPRQRPECKAGAIPGPTSRQAIVPSGWGGGGQRRKRVVGVEDSQS